MPLLLVLVLLLLFGRWVGKLIHKHMCIGRVKELEMKDGDVANSTTTAPTPAWTTVWTMQTESETMAAKIQLYSCMYEKLAISRMPPPTSQLTKNCCCCCCCCYCCYLPWQGSSSGSSRQSLLPTCRTTAVPFGHLSLGSCQHLHIHLFCYIHIPGQGVRQC